MKLKKRCAKASGEGGSRLGYSALKALKTCVGFSNEKLLVRGVVYNLANVRLVFVLWPIFPSTLYVY
jgi:hypothetical protein